VAVLATEATGDVAVATAFVAVLVTGATAWVAVLATGATGVVAAATAFVAVLTTGATDGVAGAVGGADAAAGVEATDDATEAIAEMTDAGLDGAAC
jgi:hypothetical protein